MLRLSNEVLSGQVSFGFLKEGMHAEKVLFVDKDGVYDEKTGEKLTDVKAWCGKNVERTVYVTEGGKLAEGIFVKTYPDETFIIADCTYYETEGREVEIHAFGKFTLFRYRKRLQSFVFEQ